jgi:hypothetical protein
LGKQIAKTISPSGSTYSKSASSVYEGSTSSRSYDPNQRITNIAYHKGLRKFDTIEMIEEDLEIDPVVI